MDLHYEILDDKRREMLVPLSFLKEEFYLAGGTALALYEAHRKSIDFDFFSENEFQTDDLYKSLSKELGETPIKVQDAPGTLEIIVAEDVKISLFYYPYDLVYPLTKSENLNLASIHDIGCMKLSAITGRATIKDYADLYIILKRVPLSELLGLCHKKFPKINENLILKSLVYFDDIEDANLDFMPGREIKENEIKAFLAEEVKKYASGKYLDE